MYVVLSDVMNILRLKISEFIRFTTYSNILSFVNFPMYDKVIFVNTQGTTFLMLYFIFDKNDIVLES